MTCNSNEETPALLYEDLVPLNSSDHGTWRVRSVDNAPWLVREHAIPLTVKEFIQAQRHFPIIFSSGENPEPLALMGLNEGVNVFVNDEGKIDSSIYIPAYVRRYPFILAKLSPEDQEPALCFDPSSDMVGDFPDGDPLFEDNQPSEATKNALTICESLEQAAQQTDAFIEELQHHGLLMDSEVTIQQEGGEKPFIYGGFQIIDRAKLNRVRGKVLRRWNERGLLTLIYAHLFSLVLMRDIFSRQQAQQSKEEASGSEEAEVDQRLVVEANEFADG